MRDILWMAMVASLQWGCGGTSTTGGPDTTTDTSDAPEDPWMPSDAWDPDGPCVECDDGDPCTLDLCNVDTGECDFPALDADGDGHLSIVGTDGVTACGGDDCDDTRADVHPGADEVCADGVDQDCDTVVDGPIVMGPEIRITEMDGVSQNPFVVWSGSELLVTWMESEYPGGTPEIGGRYLARLDAQGERRDEDVLLDDDLPLAVHDMVWADDRVAMASVSRSGGSGSYVHFASMSPAGEIIDVQSELSGSDQAPRLAWTGSGYGILAHGTDGPYFLLLGVDGSLVNSPLKLSDYGFAGERLGDVAWTGSAFGVSWDNLPDGIPMEHDLHVALVDAGGTAASVPQRLTNAGLSSGPSLAWSGSELGIAWHYGVGGGAGTLYFARVAEEGEKVGVDVRITDHVCVSSHVAWIGWQYVMGWLEGPGAERLSTFGAVGPGAERVGDNLPVSDVFSYKVDLDAAWTGSALAMVWSDGRAAGCTEAPSTGPLECNMEIYFNRVELCE